MIGTLALTLVIVFVIQNFVAQSFQVEQGSMERTFEQGNHVLIDKLTPRRDGYSGGDTWCSILQLAGTRRRRRSSSA